MALTDTEIEPAKLREKSYSMSDSGGLRLETTPAGGKLWRWKYRFEGKEKLMALGKPPPKKISLAVARKRHGDGRDLLATGIDPMAHRKVEKTAEWVAIENSFASVAALWLEHWKDDKSARHVDSTRRRLASTILHERGCVHDHIELQLAHAPRNAVSAAHNHALYLGPRAKMMQQWADLLEQAQRGAKVLPFRGDVD